MVDLGQKGVRNCGRLFKIHTHKKRSRLNIKFEAVFYLKAVLTFDFKILERRENCL
jgi:hypothetical protein